ncbi:MAG: hypothetical protein ACU0CC_02435 [Sagittula sp.]|jgi:hypothetical protein|uniref:hypothetical protein n=1 Tax=unclassified Sagittula TaxID=2624628 RepID=UPI000C2D5265|nr:MULTISPECIES: hypothetical protein [unclassified Sagittula]AUC53170.1 hypothetical protein CDO87_08145 [Sagittula sp. P11]WHZ35482.1 hypothetical protein QNI11_00405 [Sagittula sp. MA-2]
MKRFLTATALVSVIATGAVAQTSFDENTISTFLPNVNVEALSDEQVNTLIGIANGPGNENEKSRQMEAYLGEFQSDNPPAVAVDEPLPEVAEADEIDDMNDEGTFNVNQIEAYIPELDASTLTEQQTAALISIMNGDGNENEKKREMRAYLGIE